MARSSRKNAHEGKVKEIRDNFEEDAKHWTEIYKEGDTNVKFLTDPWNAEDRQARESAGRPVVTFDELGQYLNHAQNEVRLNPRSPKFSPEAEGATEATAQVYGNSYRKTEYRSNAQEAYTTAYDNALVRGYSFVRMKLEYEHARSFYQQFMIEPVPNPNSCFPDCNSLRTDGSDWKRFSFVESYTRAEFERSFPDAEFTDFSAEQMAAVGPRWMGDNRIQVLEHWEVECTDVELTEYEVPATKIKPQRYVTVMEGVDRKPRGGKVIQRRVSEERKVYKYLTNGVELLHKEDEPEKELYVGSMIPFAPCYGKVVWINKGSGPERQIISMVTMARQPYAAYCFAAACELEAIGTITKNPYWAYEGQLSPDQKNRIKQSLHEPVAVLEAKPRLEGLPGVLLPLPVRNPMAVDLSSYAIVKEGARRAIQAAMGFTPMQTSMQRDNQKLSGRALDRMQDTASKGSYHFQDSYNSMLRRCAVIYEDAFDKIHDVEREIITMEADKTEKRVLIGGWNGQGQAPKRPEGLDKQTEFVPSAKGRHAVVVDVGPEFESERAEAGEFLDNFIASPLFGAIEPPKRDKLLAMSIKQRMLGPMGTKMAEVIDPQPKDGELPPAEDLMAALQQAQKEVIPALEQRIQELEAEQQAKVTETEGKLAVTAQQDKTKIEIAAMQVEQKERDSTVDSQTALAIAELRAEIEMLKLKHAAEHETEALVHASVESAAGRAHTAREGDKGRQASADEGAANRDAAAEQAEQAARIKETDK